MRISFLRILIWVPALVLALGLAGGLGPSPVQAEVAAPRPLSPAADNNACLGCHSRPGLTIDLPSGEQLPISVDETSFNQSVHGTQNCSACHTNIRAYPHPERTAQTRRDYTLQARDSCKTCHDQQYQENMDGVHQKALDAGNRNAPICSDCHDPHNQKQITAQVNSAPTCARCHNAIFEQYAASVHGAGAQGKNNPDVPTCTTCHGVHRISDPTTAAFRIDSPQLCAKCHTDAAIMDKYGLSTQVLNTYVADFHGTTVTLFEKQSPDQATNKPVCYDCHGVHDIRRTDDPQKGLQVRQNLLVTCQKCHPDATDNFPDSWLSHYIPDRERYPLVYYVQLFYAILIPLVLGGMALYILTDIYRKLRTGGKKPAEASVVIPPPQDSDQPGEEE